VSFVVSAFLKRTTTTLKQTGIALMRMGSLKLAMSSGSINIGNMFFCDWENFAQSWSC
jgi:hypothetical protein